MILFAGEVCLYGESQWQSGKAASVLGGTPKLNHNYLSAFSFSSSLLYFNILNYSCHAYQVESDLVQVFSNHIQSLH